MAGKKPAENLAQRWDWPEPEATDSSLMQYVRRVTAESDKFYGAKRARLKLLVERLDSAAKAAGTKGIVSVDEFSPEFRGNPSALHRYMKEVMLLLIDRHPEIFHGERPPRRPGKALTKPKGGTRWTDEALMLLFGRVANLRLAHPKWSDAEACRKLVEKGQPYYKPEKGAKAWKALYNALSAFQNAEESEAVRSILMLTLTKRTASARKK